jgi:hypothetical protein
MENKSKLTVKREWAGAQILLEITDIDAMRISCSIDVFTEQFINKIPSMTFVLKDRTAKDLVKKALKETLSELKKESRKIL